MGRDLDEIIRSNPGNVSPDRKMLALHFDTEEVAQLLGITSGRFERFRQNHELLREGGKDLLVSGGEIYRVVSGLQHMNALRPGQPFWNLRRPLLTSSDIRSYMGFKSGNHLNYTKTNMGLPFLILAEEGKSIPGYAPFEFYAWLEMHRVDNDSDPGLVVPFADERFDYTLWKYDDVEARLERGWNLKQYVAEGAPAIRIGNTHYFRPDEIMGWAFPESRQSDVGIVTSLLLADPNNGGSDGEGTDRQAYMQLYVSIIHLAIKDYEFLRGINGRRHLSPSQRDKLREIQDSDPIEFFNSRWFEDVCGMIGVHAQAIRERLEVEDPVDLRYVAGGN